MTNKLQFSIKITPSQLPNEARKFINIYFNNTKVVYIDKINDEYEVKLAMISNGDNCFSDVEYLWTLEDDINLDALQAALEIIVNVVEYDGKISKQLLSKLYTLFAENDIYNKVYTEMMAIKDAYSSEFKRNSRKTTSHMQKRFPKSKIDEEILKLIGGK